MPELALALPEILAVAAPEAAAGVGGLASTVLPEVAVSALAPEALSLGGGLAEGLGAGLGAGALGAEGALTLGETLGSGALASLGGAGGFGTPGETFFGTSTQTPLTTTPTTTPGSTLPTATSIGGPGAPAPTAPASVTDVGVGTTGNFSPTFQAGPGTNPATFNPAVDSPGGYSAGGGGQGLGGGGDVGGASSGLRASVDKGLSSLTGGFLDSKDLGTALSVGGLGMNILNRNQPIPGQKQLANAASSLSATSAAQANLGQQLEGYLQSGTLPAGLAAGVRSATEAAKTTIRSQYANRGQQGSSAEAQDLQAAEDRALAASQEVALSLLQQGSSIIGQSANTESLAAQIYQSILNDSLSRDAQLGSAIGNFASSLAGGSGGGSNTITVKAA